MRITRHLWRARDWQNTGWGNSNGVTLEVEHRFDRGYAFQFFYVLTTTLPPVDKGMAARR